MQRLKSLVIKYLKIWWIPILSYLVPFGIYLIADFSKIDIMIDIALAIFYLNILGNVVSSIVHIFIRKWYYLIPQIGVSVFLFFITSIFFLFSPPDYYGAHKTIPKNIQISKPLDSLPTKKDFKKDDLILSSSSYQPGIYSYYTNAKTKELGSFYIKAFEITSNDKLSEERIKKRSKVELISLEPEIYSGNFTIYEGSWGDKYGARIELWFEPKNGTKDYKITERNYIVEGWMR